MKYLSAVLFTAIAATAGCSTVSNTGNNANLRNANTNTGYVTNANATAKPTIPADATNLQPGNVPMPSTTGNMNANTRPSNSEIKPMNSNTKTTPKP